MAVLWAQLETWSGSRLPRGKGSQTAPAHLIFQTALTLGLEAVMQAKLNLPCRRTDAADHSEAFSVRYAVVGISVACDVEEVEEVRAESQDVLFAPEVEILE